MSISNQSNSETDHPSKGLIMVVEDALWLLEGIQAVLQQAYYEVITAESGQQALDALRACPQPPDLIITDLMMPYMDGWELALEIRNQPSWLLIPIIFMTAYDGPTIREFTNWFGVVGTLAKPFNDDQLLREVAELLKRSRESS